MSSGLIPTIKMAAMEAVRESNPVLIKFGTVVKASPLEIKLDQNLVLRQTDGTLKLTRNVTDYRTTVSVDWPVGNLPGHTHDYTGTTKPVDDGADPHVHDYEGTTTASEGSSLVLRGTKEITIHNSLQVGDLVVLLRVQGGKFYIALDRVI